MDLTFAFGCKFNACARSADIIIIAEAPSESAEEVPAVTVPPLGLNTGRNAASFSNEVSGRMTSSISHNCLKPFSS